MEYYLSEENANKKEQYENSVAQKNEQWSRLSKEIKNIRLSKSGTMEERQAHILEKQIQMKEIELEIIAKEEAIADLYISQIRENLLQRRTNGDINALQFSNEMTNIREYKSMLETKRSIEYYTDESSIIDMKIKLERIKKVMGMIDKEQAEKNISKMQQQVVNNESNIQDQEQELLEQNYELKRKNLYYQQKTGQISMEQLREKLKELEQHKHQVVTDKQLEEMIQDFKDEYLEPSQPVNQYERKVSSRSEYHIADTWEQWNKQNINKTHEYGIYHTVQEYHNKTFRYGIELPEGQDYFDYVATNLGEDYARGLSGDKAQMAKQFAQLEVRGTFDSFKDPYKQGEQVNGYDDPKLLLQLQKVAGLNIQELEDVIGLDTSELHQDLYVATYEIEEYDFALQKNVMRPIKEYYQENENGEMTLIGTGTEEKATFTIDDMDFEVNAEQIIQGKTIEEVTQREMGDKLVKNSIEDSMENGKVIEVASILDEDFLKDFSKQCRIPEGTDLSGRTFIVSTINEKGEEDFDVIIRDDNPDEKMNTSYKQLMGIKATKNKGREMYTEAGRKLPGELQELDKTETLKEFITESGHRYSITRNAEGKLGFCEIFRENENIMQAQQIDTYTYSTDDLVSAYKSMELQQKDVSKAYETIKTDRQQTQTKDNDRGRG